MDTLAFVGKGMSTFQLVAGTLIGIVLIIVGILMLSASKGEQPATDPSKPPMSVEMKVGIGIGLLIFGIIIPYGAWINRKLVRSNNKYAAVSGAFSIFNMFD
jgi:uncharacterized membrane protein